MKDVLRSGDVLFLLRISVKDGLGPEDPFQEDRLYMLHRVYLKPFFGIACRLDLDVDENVATIVGPSLVWNFCTTYELCAGILSSHAHAIQNLSLHLAVLRYRQIGMNSLLLLRDRAGIDQLMQRL